MTCIFYWFVFLRPLFVWNFHPKEISNFTLQMKDIMLWCDESDFKNENIQYINLFCTYIKVVSY